MSPILASKAWFPSTGKSAHLRTQFLEEDVSRAYALHVEGLDSIPDTALFPELHWV